MRNPKLPRVLPAEPRRASGPALVGTAVDRIARLPAADRREAISQAIAILAGADVPRPNPLALDFADQPRSIADHLAALGTPGPARAAFTSSDLSQSVADAARFIVPSILRKRGEPEHRQMCSALALSSFASHTAPRVSPLELTEINPENGEIPAIPARVGSAQIALKTVGGIVGFSRQAVLNADWPLLASITNELIDGAIRAERSALMALIESNPTMDDHVALFDAIRSNDLTASSEVEAFKGLIAALRNMKTGPALAAGPGDFGLNSTAAVLAVPGSQEFSAAIVKAAAGLGIKLIGDSQLTRWIMIPDPQIRPTFGIGFLGEGGGVPAIDVRQGFEADSWGVRVRHDFAIAALSPFVARCELSA